MNVKNIVIVLLSGICVLGFSQTKNTATFQNIKPGYYQNYILKGIEEEKTEPTPAPKRTFKIDLTNVDYPKSIDEFKTSWINKPISQGNTGTCWSFSTTSFYETEIFRQTGQVVDLSEMFTVYWEYVEKARRFVQKRGDSEFGEGSEANAVKRMMKMYGCVRQSDFSGLKNGKTVHNHSKMYEEMSKYLQSVKTTGAWNEALVLETIKAILNDYMGTPPTQIMHQNKSISPLQYMSSVLKFNPDDLVDVMSFLEKPYWKQAEYEVPDNWWHDSTYYNVPLDVFMSIVKNSIRNGYTFMIGGDVSEAGFDSFHNVALVPTFDIPSDYIDENARQFRFSNKTTTDDHGMHLVGYMEKNGKDWYLIKDSSSGSRNVGKESKNFGYYFFHEDYIKLKMTTFGIHKDRLKDYISKFSK
ncbi:MAG: peptidase C1 [Bacteroidetes bacterium]|nr:MAG: peptidase C1 [Bacteroidota bacterium]